MALLRWLACLLILLAGTLPRAASAATYTVGAFLNPDCPNQTHTTLAGALATAAFSSSPNTILICPGSHTVISLGLTLGLVIGSGSPGLAGLTISSTTGNAADVTLNFIVALSGSAIEVQQNQVTIKDLSIKVVTLLGSSVGIRATSGNQLTLDGVVITTDGAAINIAASVPNTVLRNLNLTSSQSAGILVDSGSSGTLSISDTTINADGIGINMPNRGGTGVSISNVNISAGDKGILLYNAPDSSISNAVIRSVNTGVSLSSGGGFKFTLADLDIACSGSSGSTANASGVYVNSANNDWKMDRIKVRGCAANGVYASGGTNPKLTGIDIAGVDGDGIGLAAMSNPALRDISIQADGDGIAVDNTNGLSLDIGTLVSNPISASGNGLSFTSSANSFSIRNSSITAGTGSSNHGVLAAKVGSGVSLQSNQITAGGNGIYFQTANSGAAPSIINNMVTAGSNSSTAPMLFFGSNASVGSAVSGNCFYGRNGVNAINKDSTATYTVGNVGNYWGTRSGTSGYSQTCADANADGICDLAYGVPTLTARTDTKPYKLAPGSCTTSPITLPHHVEISLPSSQGLTCTATSVTLRVCADAACSTLYTLGFSGTLTGSNAATVFASGASFSMPSGSGTATLPMQLTTVGSTTLGVSGLSVAPSSAATCNLGGAGSCVYSAADAGFVFSLPNHRAATAQSVTFSAVRKADNSLQCTPAFASVSKPVKFSCAYQNPGSGTLAASVGGVGLNASGSAAAACDVGGKSINVAFDATGSSTLSLQYADVGQMQIAASYSGAGADAGLVMNGSSSFIAAPTRFAFSAISAAPLTAGRNFSATLSALNAADAATPNFGAETSSQTPLLTFARLTPTNLAGQTGVSDGSFSGALGSFSGGSASSSTLRWTEVGTIELTANLANYLSTGMAVGGSSGAVGAFVPDHFDLTVTPACGAFSYAGQPFAVEITARNALNARTYNHDGGSTLTPAYAKITQLSDAPALGVGSLSKSKVAAVTYVLGVAKLNTSALMPAYTYTSKLTTPRTLRLRAIDDGSVSSATGSEGSTVLRSGRLRLFNNFGAMSQALELNAQAEYWSGAAWLLNSDDNCSIVPVSSVARYNPQDHRGNISAAMNNSVSALAIASGRGKVIVQPASPNAAGSVDVALNLGTLAAACVPAPGTATAMGGTRSWLRSQYGSASCGWSGDPSARASFGVYSSETQKLIRVTQQH